MSDHVQMVWMGYLHSRGRNILLCVGEEELAVRYYLEKVRQISRQRTVVYRSAMDIDTAMALYESYMLDEYNDSIKYLTYRDMYAIQGILEMNITALERLYNDMSNMVNTVSGINELSNDVSNLNLSVNTLEKYLSRVEFIRLLSNKWIEESHLLSPDIGKYLSIMGYMEEDKELTDLFYQKLE